MSKPFAARDLGLLVLRLGLGLIFLAHGYQKVTRGWGAAWEPVLAPQAQLPVAWIEFLGGILLVAGFLTRFAALAIAGGMCIAIYISLVSSNIGFVASEFSDQAQGLYGYLRVGWEFPFAMLMQAVTVLLLGGGAYSVDSCVWGRGRPPQPATTVPPPTAAGGSAATAAAPATPPSA